MKTVIRDNKPLSGLSTNKEEITMANTSAVPSFTLKIDGSRVPPEREADIKEIIVFEKTDAPSRFEIKVNNEGFRWTDSDDCAVGSEIKLSIGYKDALQEIIVGDVTGIRANMRFGEANIATYIGYSKSHRLLRGRKSRAFTEMSVTDIVQQIASDAGMQSDVENISKVRKFTLQKDITDFNYLMSLAERYGCTITDVDNKLTFKRQVANSGEDVVVEYNKTLIEFYPTTDLNSLITEVEVRGWDRAQHQSIRGTKTHSDASSDGGKLVEDSFGAANSALLDIRVEDISEAEQLALDHMTINGRNYITGYGVSLGDPNIRADSIIKVEGIAERYKGKYYVFAAKHKLEIGVGYSTTFYISSNVATQGNAANTTGSSSVSSGGGAGGGGGQQNGAGAAAAQNSAGGDENRNPQITQLKWLNEAGEEITKSHVRERVKLTAQVSDIDDGKRVKLFIYEKDNEGDDDFIRAYTTPVREGKIELVWQVEYHPDEDDTNSAEESEEQGYTLPEYIFIAQCDSVDLRTEESPVLQVVASFVYRLVDRKGKPIANYPCSLELADGNIIESESDSEGYIVESEIPLGKTKLIL